MALTLSSCSSSVLASNPSSRRSSPSTSNQASVSIVSFDGLRMSDSSKGIRMSSLFQAPSHVSLHPYENSAAVLAIRATTADAPPLALPKQKIRIKLKSYWVDRIEGATKLILDAARSTETKIMGPVPLPTRRRVYCVLRSPHVNKDSREHFEIRIRQRLIDLENPNAGTIDALMQLDIPAGVDVEVKLS
ncbi:hypothetical protein L7F22_001114 [Adiantum nelumboides]|nr:hypothetical protein [Adiantum nelumboides]